LIGILNGFGRSLGDGIIGLQALHVAIHVGAVQSQPVLFRLPKLPIMIRALYGVADFAEIRTLPWDFATTGRRFDPGGAFAHMIDLRDFAFDPGFQQTAMIDFFLRRLGVPPDSVPAAWRRNTWLAPRVMSAQPEFPPGYVLVCPQASMRLRDMPDPIHAHVLRHALAVGSVLTQGKVPDGLGCDVIRTPPYETLEALCGLVRHARLVISTDTAMIHLADAFSVPCLAFFPTHRPQWRVRDYPRCLPVALQSRLPAGIEFARGPRDDALARSSWFPHGDDFGWLDHAIAQALETFDCA
jgi:glycosyl transferase family 9 (putative heptosyltransferase)